MHPRTNLNATAAISLILPAWNESEVILKAIEEADVALREVSDDYEIIVVDDGSTDNTASLVLQASENNPAVRLVQHNPNQGYGAALRSGFNAADKALVVFTDADCQFDLTELDRFVLLAERYDIVCGYRIDRKDTFLRCLYSRVYNQIVRILLRTEVRDVDCALKMFHRDAVKKLPISGNGFLVNSEILTQAKYHGLNIVEVGVSHRPRTEGNSTVSISHIPKVLASLAQFWWNTVQFPASNNPKTTTDANEGERFNDRTIGWLQLGLLLVAAVFLFTNLGYPLIDRDETRYAEIPREMLATGNWVLPQLNFQTYYDKPPLLYWLCALSYQIFGVSETAARLVPAFSAWLTVAMTMWFGTRNFGRRIGLMSGVVLMLSVGFMFTSRYLLLDGLLSLLVGVSLFTAYEAIRGEQVKLRWWLISGVACGLAFLTKGPLALVLWLPPVLAFAWLSQSFAKPRWWHYSLVAGIVALINGPWLIAVSMQDSEFLAEFFYKHNIARFAGEFHAKPFWFFVPVLLIAGHPWSFLTVPYTKFLFGQSNEVRSQRPPVLGFLMLWSVWCFVFFSVSKCKLPTYLLPAAPAFALMIGHYLDQVLRDSSDHAQHWFARFWSARSATATTCLAGVAFATFIIISGVEVSFMTYLWVMLWTTMLISALVLLSDRHQAKLAWVTSSGVAFLFAVMVMHQMVPAYSREQTVFGPSSPMNAQIETKARPAMATVAHEFSGVPFYLNRSDIPNFMSVQDEGLSNFVREHDRTVLVVEDRISNEELRQQLPVGTKIKSIGERGSAHLVEVTTTRRVSTIAGRPKPSVTK